MRMEISAIKGEGRGGGSDTYWQMPLNIPYFFGNTYFPYARLSGSDSSVENASAPKWRCKK